MRPSVTSMQAQKGSVVATTDGGIIQSEPSPVKPQNVTQTKPRSKKQSEERKRSQMASRESKMAKDKSLLKQQRKHTMNTEQRQKEPKAEQRDDVTDESSEYQNDSIKLPEGWDRSKEEQRDPISVRNSFRLNRQSFQTQAPEPLSPKQKARVKTNKVQDQERANSEESPVHSPKRYQRQGLDSDLFDRHPILLQNNELNMGSYQNRLRQSLNENAKSPDQNLRRNLQTKRPDDMLIIPKRFILQNNEQDSPHSKQSKVERLPQINQPGRPTDANLINLMKLQVDANASRQLALVDAFDSKQGNKGPSTLDPVCDRKLIKPRVSKNTHDDEQCENGYSSNTSEEYLYPNERQEHPRHTANYLKLMKEQEQNRTSSAQTSGAKPNSANTDSVKEENPAVEIKLNMPKLSSFMEPLPLLPKGKYQDSPTWRNKRIKRQEVERARSAGSNESQSKKAKEKRKQNELYLEQLQERLDRNADDIMVQTALPVNLDKYPDKFKYKLYESFKPTTLKQTRNYIDFLTADESTEVDELSPELQHYLVSKLTTKLPSYIKERQLLQFDSNFESGNLDSVYLVNQWEYNLMLRVDTNTRGNTYWFYFKVLNWKPDTSVTFNILNISRDLSDFYDRGMQILTRIETLDGTESTDWVAGQHTIVEEFTQSEVGRQIKGSSEEGNKFDKLRFRVKFPSKKNFIKKTDNQIADLLGQELELIPEGTESPVGNRSPRRSVTEFPTPKKEAEEPLDEKEVDGSVFCFAYSLPYTYSDLVNDLETAKKHLISIGGNLKNAKADENAKFQRQASLRDPPKVTPKNSSTGVTGIKEKVKRLSKFQLAQKEIMSKAINDVKGKLNRFETKLLTHKADLEHVKERRHQCVEILTDYLHFKQEVVSQSVGGLNIYQLTLTKRRSISTGTKKCIYITARLHAAETHGSWIIKYILSELTQNSDKYESFLNDYVIKLVPMMNPDGVTMGNARVSLVGLDLNRRWSNPDPTIHPEIFFIKEVMKDQATSQGIQIFCDLHGHNKKDNCFFYGCNKAADEGLLSWTKTRLLPKIFAQLEEIFDYKSCHFKQDKQKLNTARVVIWNEMKVTNSFTLETSQYAKNLAVMDMYGNQQPDKRTQICAKDLAHIAQSFLSSVAQYNTLEKELEAEFKLNKGWFKPQKLKEITGEAARDKNARQGNARKVPTQKSSINIVAVVKNKQSSSKNVINIEQTPKVPKKIRKDSKMLSDVFKPALERKNTQQIKRADSDRRINGVDEGNEMSVKSHKISKSMSKHKTMAIETRDQKANDSKNGSRSSSMGFGLGKWTDLFELEEIKNGINYMTKTKLATPLETLEEDEEDSDSAPSVDNFNAKELQECFKVVIGDEANPFENPPDESTLVIQQKQPQEETKGPRPLEFAEEIRQNDESSSNSSDFQQEQAVPDPEPRKLQEARTSNQFQISRVRHITNRIGYLAAQLTEIDRQRLNLAEQGQLSLMNLILQQNEQIKSSAGPPSGEKFTQQQRLEAQAMNRQGDRAEFYITPYQLQQQYRTGNIHNQPSTYPASIAMSRAQNLTHGAPNMICTGTAKFKFNIFSGIPPIQVTEATKPFDVIQGRALQPVLNAQRSVQPRQKIATDSAKKPSGQKTQPNRRNVSEVQSSGNFGASFFSNAFSPREDELHRQEPPLPSSQQSNVRDSMTHTYYSPINKPDKSFSPLVGVNKSQFVTPVENSRRQRDQRITSIERQEKIPDDNRRINQDLQDQNQPVIQMKKLDSNYKTYQASHITGFLSHNISSIGSPRAPEPDFDHSQKILTFNRVVARETTIKGRVVGGPRMEISDRGKSSAKRPQIQQVINSSVPNVSEPSFTIPSTHLKMSASPELKRSLGQGRVLPGSANKLEPQQPIQAFKPSKMGGTPKNRPGPD